MTANPDTSAPAAPESAPESAAETARTPTRELSELASALRHHLRRRARLGESKVRLPLPSDAGSGRPSTDAIAPPSPSAGGPAAAPIPRPAPPPAAQPAPRDRRPLPPPPSAEFRPPAPPPRAPARVEEVVAAVAAEAERNRALAAECSDLESLRSAVARCTSCALCKTRTQTVFADGPAKARVLFVGEAPGENEDLQGVPFVGRAGQLLTDIVEKGMGLPRASVAIANVIKCRPPGNRDPSDDEKALCTPWLDRQIELIDPELIVPLGAHAANHVLGLAGPNAQRIGAVRGKVLARGARKVVATYHPSYLLRSPGEKKECWKDIQVAMGVLGLSRPG